MTQTDSQVLIEVENLTVDFQMLDATFLRVIDGVSFKIRRGETVALVGESGSGKSVTAGSIMRLLEEPPARLGGAIRFYTDGSRPFNILDHKPSSEAMRHIRGNEIAMIFQEPMRALSPVFTAGHQVAEAILLHQDVDKKEAYRQVVEMFDKVGLPDPKRHVKEYPHQLSGGQRQRVMIAMALACRPKLLIADEPTTALDVTIQAQILDLLRGLQRDMDLAICLITHDLGIVAHNCKSVNVMYMGKIVESADVRTIYHAPKHPYTIGLLKSVPVPGRGHRQRLAAIRGVVPEPDDIPPGCAFGPRCDHFMAGVCDKPVPVPIVELDDGHWSRCYKAKEL
ncbi:ABC transporter ATP-binding protein [Candidatus Sumerlaeota bacterium]|nr:ABC transporter ATP-binding protein [Candidatus Sumerlaeota bacterium]